MQKIISGENSHRKIGEILQSIGSEKFMLVCGGAFDFLALKDYFAGIDIPHIRFSDFSVNPLYEDVVKGVELLRSENCDVIVAVGGGSSIDVAKCIKLFAKMTSGENYLKQEFFDSEIPLLALPTTAGTGSESTRYAVIYYDGQKQSVTHDSIVPDYAILDSTVLKTLPLYQRKCTLLDALCQGIESWWSVNSTDESFGYSEIAVKTIIKNYRAYIFENDDSVLEDILLASNFAGRAINITQTTAAHALSYKMTSLFSLPHGHAVAIGLPHIWEYMIKNPQKCIDQRGKDHLLKVCKLIAEALGCESPETAVVFFKEMLAEMGIEAPNASDDELEVLAASVNPVRLKNNPVELDHETLYTLYTKITE